MILCVAVVVDALSLSFLSSSLRSNPIATIIHGQLGTTHARLGSLVHDGQ